MPLTLTGTFVHDIFGDIWHLWTHPGGVTDCALRVENAWLVTRLTEPTPGRYCTKCFNDSAIGSPEARLAGSDPCPRCGGIGSPHVAACDV